MKYFIALPAVLGGAIWVAFVWRRLTKWAVIVQVFLCFTLYAVAPNLFPTLEVFRDGPAYLVETRPREVTIVTGALLEDVEAGRAHTVGQTIEKAHLTEPVGIYFESVVRADPTDPDSPKSGRGRFNAEVWVLSWLGFDFRDCSKAQLTATRFYFSAFFPFVLLFLLSIFTRPNEKRALDRFYGKLHTPVRSNPEDDARAVEDAAVHPEQYEAKKLFPGTSWEFLRPGLMDWVGFFGSWLVVLGILGLLWLMATIGS